jgi:hypothetical protein
MRRKYWEAKLEAKVLWATLSEALGPTSRDVLNVGKLPNGRKYTQVTPEAGLRRMGVEL